MNLFQTNLNLESPDHSSSSPDHSSGNEIESLTTGANNLSQEVTRSEPLINHVPISETIALEVALFHKPKGSQGLWNMVQAGQRLRVTKGFGKRLKLKISSPVDFEKSSLVIQLFDLDLKTSFNAETNGGSNSFIMESAKVYELTIEVAIKIFRMGGRFQFICQLQSKLGAILQGCCCEFISYSSGSVREKPPASHPIRAMAEEIDSPEPKRKKIENISVEAKPANLASLGLNMALSESFSALGVSPANLQLPETHTVIPGSLEVRGSVKAKAFIQWSDVRLKTNINELVDAIKIVTSLQGKRYQWISQKEGEETHVIGLIAQQVQKVLPEVVYEDPETGILSVSYAEILPVLIEAFKEFLKNTQDDKNEIKGEIDTLKAQLDKLSIEVEKTNADNNRIQELVQQMVWLRGPENLHKMNSHSLLFLAAIQRQKDTHFCRVTRLVFAAFLALSVILSVIGLVVAYENDTEGLFIATSNSASDPNVPADSNDSTWDHNLLLGLALFFVGIFGILVFGIGICATSVWITISRRQFLREERRLLELQEKSNL